MTIPSEFLISKTGAPGKRAGDEALHYYLFKLYYGLCIGERDRWGAKGRRFRVIWLIAFSDLVRHNRVLIFLNYKQCFAVVNKLKLNNICFFFNYEKN